MGYVKVKMKVKVRNVHKSELEAEAELLVDTGSIYTILGRERLEALGIEVGGKR